MPRFSLKWTEDDPSRAIILTFHSAWESRIRDGLFRAIFRKMGPRQIEPDTLYAYVARPLSAIIARMSINENVFVPVKQALELSDEGAISKSDLERYAIGYSELLVYRIRQIDLASKPVDYETLAQQYGYFPSSTFIPLSGSGQKVLDSLGGFSS